RRAGTSAEMCAGNHRLSPPDGRRRVVGTLGTGGAAVQISGAALPHQSATAWGLKTLQELLETHRSFVNTWESDENAHMNVQFYLKRFDEAARFFDLLSGGGVHDRPLPRDRHVRYHAELTAGSTTLVRSAVIADGPFEGRVVHFLENSETGALSATALDSTSRPDFKHRIPAEKAAPALPRSAPAEPLTPVAPEKILASGGLVTNRSVVSPADCGATGHMSEQAHVAR